MTLPILERFAHFLEQSERSPVTIRGYLADLKDFQRWFQEAGNEGLDPSRITSTVPSDLR